MAPKRCSQPEGSSPETIARAGVIESRSASATTVRVETSISYFIIATLAAMLSKHVLRTGGVHVYNPSNLGLVLCFLVFGVSRVFPQYLWWGPIGPSVALALGVILVGAIWILRPLHMLPMVMAFLVAFATLIAFIAAAGRCFLAIWHTVVCSLVPLIDGLAGRLHGKVPPSSPARGINSDRRPHWHQPNWTAGALTIVLITVIVPLTVMVLATDQQIVAIEAGETVARAPGQ